MKTTNHPRHPRRSAAAKRAPVLVLAAVVLALLTGCGEDPATTPVAAGDQPSSSRPSVADDVDGMFEVGDGRRLHLRCTGSGSPTIVLEGGDDDSTESYAYAEDQLAAETRTCTYDRANLGQSDPDTRCRGLSEIVTDLERLLAAADVPAPYVLVGTSGGGHIAAGFAVEHPTSVAGMVFVEVPPPFPDPPAFLVTETRCGAPDNIESRDYLQLERDAWAARRPIGDVPITVISNEFSPQEVAAAAPFERALVRDNVERQRGWLVLSPRAEQVVVHTGHEVEAADPQLVIDSVLDVVRAARG